MMKLGLFMDLRNPPEWPRSWQEVYSGALARVELAESVGLESAWLTEHHLCEDGYLPQPLTFAAAIAARTRRIRIGTGVLLAPLRPALDIAEQAAVVDILSGGRLELGLGAGYRLPDFDAYGVDAGERFRLLDERVREVRRLWEEGIATPRPVQERVPIWIGTAGPKGARRAGRLGEGLLWLDESLLPPYLEGLAEAGLPATEARMGGLVNMILSRDPERAWARIERHVLYHGESYRRYGVEGTAAEAEATATPVRVEDVRSSGPAMTSPVYDVVTPAEAERRLRAWLGDLPVHHAFFWDSIAQMPDDLADEHIALLGEELAPAMEAPPGAAT